MCSIRYSCITNPAVKSNKFYLRRNKEKKIFSLILVLALALTGCSSQPAATSLLKDGTYTGTGKGLNGDVKVEVVIKSDVIESVTVLEHSETPGISGPALEGVPAAIVDADSAVLQYQQISLNNFQGYKQEVCSGTPLFFCIKRHIFPRIIKRFSGRYL